MKRNWLMAWAILLIALSSAQAQVKSITAIPDHADHLYKAGETATFTVSALDAQGQPVRDGILTAVFRNDFRDELSKRQINLADANPASVSSSFDKPGFLSIQVSGCGSSAMAGVGFDPTKIEPGQPCPDDFDAFWTQGKKAAAELNSALQLEEIPTLTTDKHTIYTVAVNTLHGKKAYGFLSVPKSEGKHPILVNVPGAGPGTGPDLWNADRGFLVLNMNVFPYPVPLNGDERKKAYDDYNGTIQQEGYPRYCHYKAEDRELYFFRDAYLGINEAIELVAARPDADPARMYLYGTSQGGASALILGGLNGRFKAIVSNVPALCDHCGGQLGRNPGWPKVLDAVKAPEAVKAVQYTDGVNFARKITCPIRVTVGFIDTTCSPSSVYAAFNVIPAQDKQIWNETLLGHATGEKARDAFNWLIKSEVK